jgi:two-component system phosphate regulon sensor histidine kinase PhoR
MAMILGWVTAAAIAGAWWWVRRREGKDWQHLRQLLDALSEGRTPAGFVFRRGGKFAQLTFPLEKLAAEQERLRQQISHDAFNLRTILASMEEGVMVVDAQHVVRLVNPSFLQLFDVKGDPLGQTVLRTLRETAFEELITTALNTSEAQTGEITLSAVKPPRHFAAHAVPMREQNGAPGVVMIVRDISRLKQLEEVRREFVANVSHELRTPLSIFQGYLENLLDDPTMARKEQAEIFDILRKHSSRLNALLEDLLTIARLEARHEKLSRQELSLGELIRGVADDWTGKMEQKKLTLVLDLAPDLPRLFADRGRLEQVLHNLLQNAVKYTEPTGRITLSAAADSTTLTVRVEDTGIGIPPTDLPHIFERFYRADKARTREHGGTGLGLSIVKHIVHLHGGTVAAESTYGKGTTILLHLPLSPAPGDSTAD